jgi:hypothetical protein
MRVSADAACADERSNARANAHRLPVEYSGSGAHSCGQADSRAYDASGLMF